MIAVFCEITAIVYYANIIEIYQSLLLDPIPCKENIPNSNMFIKCTRSVLSKPISWQKHFMKSLEVINLCQ